MSAEASPVPPARAFLHAIGEVQQRSQLVGRGRRHRVEATVLFTLDARRHERAAARRGVFGRDDGDDIVVNAADAAALVVLGRACLHTGDAGRSRRYAEIALAVREGATPAVRRHLTWLLTLLAVARGDHDAARSHLAGLADIASEGVLPTFPLDVTDPPQLVRVALAIGDVPLAREAVLLAEEWVRLHPGVASIVGGAAHARALADGVDGEFADAIASFAASPRPLALASAVEDAGRVTTARGDREHGVEDLGRALQMYTRMGATWDAARVRGRLRTLGIRRRLSASGRPAAGLASLTESERVVSELVAQGLTNREVSERLFISPHTVNTHLRHAFTKLAIRSRVELTRTLIAGERQDRLAPHSRPS